MSIIEEAVRRTQRHNRVAPPPETMLNRPRARRPAATPVDAANVRSFQSVELDDDTLAENNILPQITDAAALRAYKILRTRLLRRLEANQWRSLAITGVTTGEGKTLTAINLAIALAQEVNTWVFLVDLDLQRPRVADYLGISGMHGEQGVSDYLMGNATFESVVYSPNIERLSVIPNFHPITQASELLSS